VVSVEQRCDQQIVTITKALPVSFSGFWDPGAFMMPRIIILTMSFQAESFLLKMVPFTALSFVCRMEKSL